MAQSVGLAKPCRGTVHACWCWIGVDVVASWHATSGPGDPKLGMWLGRLGLQSPAGARCRHVGVGLGSMLWPLGMQHQAPVTRNSKCGSVGCVCNAPQGHGVGMLVLDWGRCCGRLACNIRPR